MKIFLVVFIYLTTVAFAFITFVCFDLIEKDFYDSKNFKKDVLLSFLIMIGPSIFPIKRIFKKNIV